MAIQTGVLTAAASCSRAMTAIRTLTCLLRTPMGARVARSPTTRTRMRSPTWSHDGRWIYYRQDRPEGPNIVRIPSDGGSPQPLTKSGALYPLESWDGTRLLFTKTEGTSPLYTHPRCRRR